MASLSEEELEKIRAALGGKIGVVDWNGHQLVFRRPTRDQIREYRVKQESGAVAKADAMDQLAQQTIVAFDGNTDLTVARMAFLTFLDQSPAFTSATKPMAILSALSGLVEQEYETDLGKGARILDGRPKTSPEASPSGSAASSTAAS